MTSIKALTFKPLALTAIKPTGWVRRQLEIQAEGLTGHLDEFWPDVRDSAWFGGEAEGWERAPYWLDGIMPLAYLLEDDKLIAKVQGYLDYILCHQHEDGWLGPTDPNVTNPESKQQYDIWAQFLALKVLVQYYEITSDERVEGAVYRCLRKVDCSINWTPLFDWGQARWFEAFISILWLYQRKPEAWLLALTTKLEAQGFGWKSFFSRWPMTSATTKGGWNFMSHIVNNAMAVKAYGLLSRVTKSPDEKLAVDNMIALLDEHHGTAVGTFTGDECLAGKEPTRGTELCAIVEYMYSLEHLVQIFGDVKYSDRLEKIAYNALPAAFTRDMWAHQYDQQTNQIACAIDENMPWSTNDPDANIYGLAPHFGCCTSNYHQGWPKLLASQWMTSTDGGVVATIYAPSKLTTQIQGVETTLELITDYPFNNHLTFIIGSEKANSFPLYIRIPQWCPRVTISLDGDSIESTESGSYFRLKRTWHRQVAITVVLEMPVSRQKRLYNAISLERGPLVFSLPIDYEQKQVNQDKPLREYPHCDYEFRAKSAWNFALKYDGEISLFESAVDTEIPFSNEHFPVTLTIDAKQLPQWQMLGCIAAPVPHSPVASKSEPQNLVLVPFGCTHLRITEFPYYFA
ncbi:conserved hypothetical protein [Alteromonas sp. 38]|uniref:beta-L-arabinofuranosidase domain-containing protein n=1 Tax=Alteromonas TaxID=226 RepID=UPI0012F26591|nr:MULTISPECIES: beta-L-arabinofuranosidase domain-containing protein [Alteromonas]CAD5256084.1 conserved hypothetical protein [Alteromonas sp. 154]VXA95047.1 conserved hypothetical protein [Alteromonas sp. 38]